MGFLPCVSYTTTPGDRVIGAPQGYSGLSVAAHGLTGGADTPSQTALGIPHEIHQLSAVIGDAVVATEAQLLYHPQ